MMRALTAEFAKLKHSRVIMWTCVAVMAYGAIYWAVYAYFGSPGGLKTIAEAGGVYTQAYEAGLYEKTWANGLANTPQMLAGGLGIYLFAFVAAYVFGHEYKEGTVPVAFTAPVRREYAVLSKLIVLGVWVFALALLSLLVIGIELVFLGYHDFAWGYVLSALADTMLATFVLYLTLPVFAWLAVLTRGYLWPMLAALILNGQGMSMTTSDASLYYPWNMSFHLFGASWYPISPAQPVAGSWMVLGAVFVLALAATLWQTDRADVTA